jgi:ATP synthase F1 complex assembly factor 2
VKETPAGLEVHLDARPVRKPDKAPLVLPSSKPHLATAIALEWDTLPSTAHALKAHNIPLTSLAARALALADADKQRDATARDGIAALAMRYLGTDTLLCWAPPPDRAYRVPGEAPLRDVQRAAAARVAAELAAGAWPGVVLRETLEEGSILPREPVSAEHGAVVRAWVAGLPAWELAALERGVLAAKSLLVAARLVVEWSPLFRHLRAKEGERFGVEEAARVASLEVAWQIERWGEVEDTHDVDREDLKRQLGSVVLLVHEEEG